MDRDDHTKPTHSPPIIEACLEKYAPYLADENLSETEKRALIEALWKIICGFVQLGFGVTPLDHIQPSGKLPETSRITTLSEPDLIQSTHSVIEKFVTADDEESAPDRKGVKT